MFPNNYDGSILEFWKRQLIGEFNHIVDIGCGNGALVWICNEILNQGSGKTHLTGVDFADISPFKALGREVKIMKGRFTGIESVEIPEALLNLAMRFILQQMPAQTRLGIPLVMLSKLGSHKK